MTPRTLRDSDGIFEIAARQDLLLHHPFDAFTAVLELIRQAAIDPNVLAIKQTLYRTGKDSLIVDALIQAARNGKDVTVVVELRARFDEEANLGLADRLQEAGVQVVYGVVGYKTHAKMLLIVRREGRKLRRYVHLGTGNYHAGNAKLYTDYSLLTSDDALCEDVGKLFSQLIGMGKTLRMKKLLHAPFTLKKGMLDMIARETQFALDGRCSAQLAAPRCARREPTAKCRSNRPRGDLRRAKVDDFGMSEELTALRAVALPAARDGAGRLATSFLTTPARGTRSQTAIPRRANAAVPALETCAAPVADWDFSSDGRTSARDVASRYARPRLTAARS